jgi:hypothetical protein
MKHVLYILLSALALFLAACKKKHDVKPHLEGNWREIGHSGLAMIWYPDTFRAYMTLENNRYTHSTQGTIDRSGAYQQMTVEEYGTGKPRPGIRFDGQPLTYTISFVHDTLVLTDNSGVVCGYSLFLVKK